MTTPGLGVQVDFGGFDPRFLGITIRFETLDTWERFKTAADSHNANWLATLPDAEAFQLMAESTVLEHETRHFHDFLLSPYSQLIFRAKLQATVDGLQAISLLLHLGRQGGANCLPVPVARWCRMSLDERKRQVDEWNRGWKRPPVGLGWVPPDLPILPQNLHNVGMFSDVVSPGSNALERLLAATVRAYDRISDLLGKPGALEPPTPYQPWHVMELSALLVQCQQVWNVYGEKAAQVFRTKIAESGFPASAISLLDRLENLWHSRGLAIPVHYLSAIVTWALLGDYESEGSHACPARRITELYALLEKSGPPPPSLRARDLFDDWTKRTTLSNPFETLRNNVRKNENLLEQLRTLKSVQKHRGQRKAFNVGQFDAAAALLACTKHMRTMFEADPDAYVFPNRYLQELSNYVRPPVRGECGHGLWLSPLGEKGEAWFGRNVIWMKYSDDGKKMVRTWLLPVKLAGINLISDKAAINLYISMLLSDYWFQPDNRLDWEFHDSTAIKRELPGLVPLNITG
jgi:hypothetical protein